MSEVPLYSSLTSGRQPNVAFSHLFFVVSTFVSPCQSLYPLIIICLLFLYSHHPSSVDALLILLWILLCSHHPSVDSSVDSLSVDLAASARPSLYLKRAKDVRLPGKGNSHSHGARPVHLIITMIKWIRTSRLSVKNSLSVCGFGGECTT